MQRQIVVLGAGGHARVVIDILEEAGAGLVVGCLCPETGLSDQLGYPILGGDDRLPELARSGIRSAVVAVGENGLRRKLSLWVLDNGIELITAVSPKASVSRKAAIGKGSVIAPAAAVNACAAIGEGVIINTSASVDHDCEIGAYSHIAPGAHLAGKVVVGEGALIGIGASILPGVRIGAWATVGAGAVVHRDVADHSMVVGVPAAVLPRKRELRDP